MVVFWYISVLLNIFCIFPPLVLGNYNPPFLGDPIDDQSYNVEFKLENIEPIRNVSFRTPAPRALIPTFYKIQIRPLFDPLDPEEVRFTVPGSVTILVDCVSNTRSIKLHAKFIEVKAEATKVTLKGSEGQEIGIESQDGTTQEGIYQISTRTPLLFGATYEIYVEYTARVFRDRLDGLYLSNYTNPTSNQTEYLVVTHFEPQGARQLFPGFDDPDLKSKFEVSVGHRDGYSVLSNMESNEVTPSAEYKGWHWSHFPSTVKMSTYLLAIVVSKFKSEEADLKLFGGKSVKIWAAAHHMEKGGGVYGAAIAAKILNYYQTYFNTTYPLPKMDSAAIPHFEAGAMENYGLNTYREKYLLYFDGVSTEAERFRVCSVIGHELGHQWFGDLVTCKSWSQLWLNEGFAAFVENIGANEACREFDPWSLFVSQTMQVAMQYDQSSITHPIVNESDTTAKFTRITYNKGASLLRMIRDFLGESTFLRGLQNYLGKLSFGNAHQDDLFAALEEQARKDGTGTWLSGNSLSDLMENWTFKKGFPLVRVSIVNATTISLSQEVFEKPKYLRDSRSTDDLWWIPVKLGSPAGNPDLFWIPSYIGSLEKNGIDTHKWFIINSEAIGYYRVFYDTAILEKIKIQLDDDPSPISPNSRSQILDDYFNFAFLNYVNVKASLELTTYLHKETSYNVWITVYTNLRRTLALLSSTPAQQSLRDYLKPKMNSVLKLIGFEQPPNEKGIQVNFRAFLLAWACNFKDQECEAYALKLFKEWMTLPNKNQIPVDIQSTIYCTAVRLDPDNSVWNFVVEKYQEETGNQKSLLLNSLACSKNNSNTDKMLRSLFESESVNSDHTAVDSFIRKLVTFPSGRKVLFKLIQERPKRIVQIYKKEKKVAEILKLLSSYFHGQVECDQLQRMIAENGPHFALTPESTRAILDLIDDNRTWMSKYYEPIKSWTEDQISPLPRRRFPKF